MLFVLNADDRPLLEEETCVMNDNLGFLTECIDSADSGLLDELYRVRCITLQQRKFLKEVKHEIKRNSELLDILTRRSFANFQQFIVCLNETGQSHVARVLEEGGGKWIIQT